MRSFKEKSYEYIENLIGAESQEQQLARKNSDKLGLSGISLSATEGLCLQFFARSLQAEKILEIGTLTGLSALYLLEKQTASACLWTLEKSAEHAELATESLKKYIENKQCQIIVGDAQNSLQDLKSKGPFDLIFIDGNKAAYLNYFNWALENLRIGGIILVDNIFLSGAVWGQGTSQKFNEKQIAAVHSVNQQAFENKKLNSMIIPTQEGLLVCKKQF